MIDVMENQDFDPLTRENLTQSGFTCSEANEFGIVRVEKDGVTGHDYTYDAAYYRWLTSPFRSCATGAASGTIVGDGHPST